MKDWKEEFDKEFDLYNTAGYVYIQPDVLKNFISSLISQQRKEVLELLDKSIKGGGYYVDQEVSRRINEIKSLINKQ